MHFMPRRSAFPPADKEEPPWKQTPLSRASATGVPTDLPLTSLSRHRTHRCRICRCSSHTHPSPRRFINGPISSLLRRPGPRSQDIPLLIRGIRSLGSSKHSRPRNRAAALGSYTEATPILNSRICFSSRSILLPALTPATRIPRSLQTCRVCVPIEPVEPKIEMIFIVIFYPIKLLVFINA